MDNICVNIEENNSNKKRKILTVFDNMIADMLTNKKLIPIEFFMRSKKLNSSLVFIILMYQKY